LRDSTKRSPSHPTSSGHDDDFSDNLDRLKESELLSNSMSIGTVATEDKTKEEAPGGLTTRLKKLRDFFQQSDSAKAVIQDLHHHLAGSLGITMLMIFAVTLLMFPFVAEPRLREKMIVYGLHYLFTILFVICVLANRFLYHLSSWSKKLLAGCVIAFAACSFTFLSFKSSSGINKIGGNPYPYAAVFCGLLHADCFILITVVTCLQESYYIFSLQGIGLLFFFIAILEGLALLLIFIPTYTVEADDKFAVLVVFFYSLGLASLTEIAILVMLLYVLKVKLEGKIFFFTKN